MMNFRAQRINQLQGALWEAVITQLTKRRSDFYGIPKPSTPLGVQTDVLHLLRSTVVLYTRRCRKWSPLLASPWIVTVIPKCLNFATFSRDLLSAFILWYCPAFCWRDSYVFFQSLVLIIAPVIIAARCKAWTVFARSNAGIVGSKPTQGMDVCIACIYPVFLFFV
jgi:hypothetical protein